MLALRLGRDTSLSHHNTLELRVRGLSVDRHVHFVLTLNANGAANCKSSVILPTVNEMRWVVLGYMLVAIVIVCTHTLMRHVWLYYLSTSQRRRCVACVDWVTAITLLSNHGQHNKLTITFTTSYQGKAKRSGVYMPYRQTLICVTREVAAFNRIASFD